VQCHFYVREIQTLFGGYKYTVIAISLVHYKSCILRTVMRDLVLLFDIAQRQNICYPLWVVPNITIALQVTFLSDNCLAGVSVQGKCPFQVPNVGQQFLV